MSELLYRLDQSTDYKRECLSDTRHEIDGFFDVVPEDLMTRAEWEASIDYKAAEFIYLDYSLIDPDDESGDAKECRRQSRLVVNAALNIEEDS